MEKWGSGCGCGGRAAQARRRHGQPRRTWSWGPSRCAGETNKQTINNKQQQQWGEEAEHTRKSKGRTKQTKRNAGERREHTQQGMLFFRARDGTEHTWKRGERYATLQMSKSRSSSRVMWLFWADCSPQQQMATGQQQQAPCARPPCGSPPASPPCTHGRKTRTRSHLKLS